MLAHRDTHLTAPAPASVALVCDAGPQVGIGHVMRCLALAEELLARGSDVTLVADLAELPWAQDQAERRGVRVAAPGTGAPPDAVLAVLRRLEPAAVVIDSYRLPASFYETVRAGHPVLALVDGDVGGRHADVYVDQNIGAEEKDWELPPGSIRLAGLDYALMRDDLRAHRPTAPRVEASDPPRVLAFFGGTDAYGVAPLVARALVASASPWTATVVAATPALRAELEAVEVGPGQELTIIEPTDRLAEKVAAADVVVSAAGTSSWELFCLGSAVAFVCVADNQSDAYRRVVREGLALGLGTIDELAHEPGAIEAAGAALRGVLEDPAERARLRAATWQRVDGAGRVRVVDTLAGFRSRD